MENKNDSLRTANEEANKITRESLQTALIYLMNEKPFDKITVTELVKRSGVSRMAFYRNYSSTEDILDEIIKLITNALKKQLRCLSCLEDLNYLCLEIFSSIKENADFVRMAANANMPADYSIDKIKLSEFIPVENVEDKYNIAAFEGAADAVVSEWFSSGMAESPEFMAAYCCQLLLSIIKKRNPNKSETERELK
ncbi:MAG: TetR family transcriptional regulator [Oscillospiraceae bacterium]|nr:TetR family transcriptional regulator [Oscillospiraceae bacterium]